MQRNRLPLPRRDPPWTAEQPARCCIVKPFFTLDWRFATSEQLIGLFWPPQRQPVLLTMYLTEAPETLEQCSATIAAVARAVAEALAAQDAGAQ